MFVQSIKYHALNGIYQTSILLNQLLEYLTIDYLAIYGFELTKIIF